jgi:acetyl-CoA carboxylase carboxyltransferase component
LTKRRDDAWDDLLDDLEDRIDAATAMGGPERLARQAAKGRLNARERVARLCDEGTFKEIGALGGAAHPAGGEPVPADALVGGVARVNGRSVVVIAEDFTVQGGSIGHVNAAKRLRLAMLAQQERIPLMLLLDGAGERASNMFERYPFAPNDLQVVADLQGQVPVVTLVLGVSAGHGALTGVFADLIIMTENASLFAAGPPVVLGSLGIEVTPEELGAARIHTAQSGVAHNLAADEDEALSMARRFLSYLPQHAGAASPEPPAGRDTDKRLLDNILDAIPADHQRPYDMRPVLEQLVDAGSLLEVQSLYGKTMLTAFARIGGRAVLIVASQPAVGAGAITAEAAEKATHFLRVAGSFGLPVVFLTDTPGVMPGPEAERVGTLRAAAGMYLAQRAVRAPKVHVTLRKAFGFGSSLMAMNPFDRQTLTLAFTGISLGGLPAQGGAAASKASDADSERMSERQSGAWAAADNLGYDRVIDPRDLRNELIEALGIRNADGGHT